MDSPKNSEEEALSTSRGTVANVVSSAADDWMEQLITPRFFHPLPSASSTTSHAPSQDGFYVDSFRAAVTSSIDKQPPTIPDNTKTSSKPVERRCMSIEKLQELLDGISPEPQTSHIPDPVDDDVFGLLDEEERAIADEFIDEGRRQCERPSKPVTRADDMAADLSSSSSDVQFIGVTRAADRPPTPPSEIVPEVSSTDNESCTLDSRSIPRIREDTIGDGTLGMIDEIIQAMPSRVVETFVAFADSVIPLGWKSLIPGLVHVFRTCVLGPFLTPYLPALDIELRSTAISPLAECRYRHLMRLLCLSCCSETPCERTFSKARLLCGTRLYRLKTASLNAKLILSYHKDSAPP